MVRVYWLGGIWLRVMSPVLGDADWSFRSLISLVMMSYCLVVVDMRRALASVS